MKNNKELKDYNTIELFDAFKNSFQFSDMEDNEVTCPDCGGTRLVYEQKDNKTAYINVCTHCCNGRLYKCKHCGELNSTDFCHCKDAIEERRIKYESERKEKKAKLFEKAEKILYKDYEGYFIWGDEAIYEDELGEKLYDVFYFDGEDTAIEPYIWATTKINDIRIDIFELINNQVEYYFNENNFNYENDKGLIKAQDIVDKWYKKEGSQFDTYCEDYNKAVLIGDLIDEVKQKVRKDKK